MKCRISYFNRTVLKKDIFRYAPLWALYLIAALLTAFTIARLSSTYSLVSQLGEMIGPMSVLSMLYAFCAAQLLFGDLFSSRLCYALHAMPLRREGWFVTHITAGMLYSVVPNLLVALMLLPYLGSYWFTALLWLLGMTLSYLFFFGLAVLCMMLSGNRLAASAIYALINALSPIAMWFCTTVYKPMLYGIVISDDIFALLCPVWLLCGLDWFFGLEHAQNCACMAGGKPYVYDVDRHVYHFSGLSDSWLPLCILAVLGVGLLVAALLLYRRRSMESAGDFVAIRAVKPVFSLIYTLCVAAVMQMIGTACDDKLYIFMMIGLIVGYFTGQMLLERTLRVFRGRSWVHLGLIAVLLLCSFGLCRIDIFGVVRWVPNAEDVVSVKLADHYVTNFTESNTAAELTDPDNIALILQAHQNLIEEGDPEDRDYIGGYSGVTICYTLRSGREVYRQYRPVSGNPADKLINRILYCDPTVLLKAESLMQLKANVVSIKVDGLSFGGATPAATALLEALWADCEAGTFYPDDRYAKEDIYSTVVIVPRRGNTITLAISSENTQSAAWLKSYHSLYLSEELLLSQVYALEVNGVTVFKQDENEKLFSQWAQLFLSEESTPGILTYPTTYCYPMTILYEDGDEAFLYVTESAPALYSFLQEIAQHTYDGVY